MYCPPLTITFLGTGTSSGVPMIGCRCAVCTSVHKHDKRLRSSIIVRSENTTLVVDTTPDFRYQMLREDVTKLDAVLFTHPHKDHIGGLDDVRAFNFFQHRPMDIYCNAITEEALHKEFHYVFATKKYPGLPSLNIYRIQDDGHFMVGDIPVQVITVMHLKMPVLGFRFGHFTYITDANYIDEHNMQKIAGSGCMVINALRHEKHISHFSLSEAITIAETVQAPATYFTHISHQLGLHASVQATLPGNMHLAYDGLQLNFSEYLS